MATARKLPSGSWRVRVYAGKGTDGKPLYKSFTAATKKDAEFLAAKYATDKKAEVRSGMTLAEAYTKYIVSKSNVISPTTFREYTHAKDRDFQELMNLKLSQITQENVQNAVNRMAMSCSPKSVRNAHGLLSAVLRMFAPEIRLNTRLPQPRKSEIYVPVESEIEQLLHDIQGTELEKAVLLAAFGSLRRSECCALLRSDIDGDTITVNKAMVWSNDRAWVVKQPKSKAGYRTLRLPHFVMERITAGEAEHIVNRVPTSITNQFKKALDRSGLPHFRFHDLRHFQASILHALGVPDKYIMERGGWKTDSTLKNIYQHTMSDKRKEVEQDICELFDSRHKSK